MMLRANIPCMSDITAPSLSGKFTARQREIYDIVLGAAGGGSGICVRKSRLRRNVADSLHDIAYNYINTHGRPARRAAGEILYSWPWSLCRFECSRSQRYDVPLGRGPSLLLSRESYPEEKSGGLRILFYVDQSGKLINLTEKLPHTADDVERAMAGK
jgi:Xaa-Pro aminopeptidase